MGVVVVDVAGVVPQGQAAAGGPSHSACDGGAKVRSHEAGLPSEQEFNFQPQNNIDIAMLLQLI
jgi:hypothetical protein